MFCTARVPDADNLDRLVTLLDAAMGRGGWYQAHQLVKVEADVGATPSRSGAPIPAGAFKLGLKPLGEGEHPLDHLLGLTAPPEWLALGAVCFGWAAPAEGVDAERGTTTRRASLHPERRRVRVTALVDRQGNERATACLEDGAVSDQPGSGTICDALRRCLGLATAPPPAPTSELFAGSWLSALLGSPDLATMGWAAAARLHPASGWPGGCRRGVSQADLVEAGRSLAETGSWAAIRSSVASGRPVPLVAVSPEVAAWMDDGMFARWALADRPPLDALFEAVALHARPALSAKVRKALDAWAAS